jgi:RNA polymerase sigma-70 factor (ECF subfamily)
MITAVAGDRDAFEREAEPYRRELQLHCYQMLASLHDAEDLVQETYLRAWRALPAFEGKTSLRRWLYRIATNACLDQLRSGARARRVLPDAVSGPSDGIPTPAATEDASWLEPYPDDALAGIADSTPGPDARYEMREAVQLAFVAAIQHLPARQRAVLLLCDVLGWSAAEASSLLEASTASVNSALQRARATLKARFPDGPPNVSAEPDTHQRALLDSYLRAWQALDVDGLVSLLRNDAVLNMPPWREWYSGRNAIRGFFNWAWSRAVPGSRMLVPTGANRQPAFAHYILDAERSQWRLFSIQVLTPREGAVAAMTLFGDERVLSAFGLPVVLPAP